MFKLRHLKSPMSAIPREMVAYVKSQKAFYLFSFLIPFSDSFTSPYSSLLSPTFPELPCFLSVSGVLVFLCLSMFLMFPEPV